MRKVNSRTMEVTSTLLPCFTDIMVRLRSICYISQKIDKSVGEGGVKENVKLEGGDEVNITD